MDGQRRLIADATVANVTAICIIFQCSAPQSAKQELSTMRGRKDVPLIRGNRAARLSRVLPRESSECSDARRLTAVQRAWPSRRGTP
jgi:hypothetical protein